MIYVCDPDVCKGFVRKLWFSPAVLRHGNLSILYTRKNGALQVRSTMMLSHAGSITLVTNEKGSSNVGGYIRVWEM